MGIAKTIHIFLCPSMSHCPHTPFTRLSGFSALSSNSDYPRPGDYKHIIRSGRSYSKYPAHEIFTAFILFKFDVSTFKIPLQQFH